MKTYKGSSWIQSGLRHILTSSRSLLHTGILGAGCVAALSSQASEPGMSVVERGPHHAVWQQVSEHTTSYGRRYFVTNFYQELATGKHYLNRDEWLPSVPS